MGRMPKCRVKPSPHISRHRVARSDRLPLPAREGPNRSDLLTEAPAAAAVEQVQSETEGLARCQSGVQGSIDALGMLAARLVRRAGDIAKECDEGVHE